MSSDRDLERVSHIAKTIGAVLLFVAIVLWVTAPTEKPFGTDGWFESASARNHRLFTARGAGMLGVFLLIGGTMFSRRGRGIARLLTTERSAAQARGFFYDGHDGHEGTHVDLDGSRPPAAERLRALDDLRRAGLITSSEYAEKRARLIAEL